MITQLAADPLTQSKVRTLVMRERQIALSEREWKHRLAGYGYAVKDTVRGRVVTTLPHGAEVCVLPHEALSVTVSDG